MKSILKIGTPIVIAAICALAADKPGGEVHHYSGKLTTVNAGAGTLSLVAPRGPERNLTLLITANTRFLRNGKYVSSKDAKIGEEVSGDYELTNDGERRALTVYLGALPRFNPAHQLSQLPVAQRIPGKPGLVYSPFDPSRRPIYVGGLPSGSKAVDPLTQKIFIVGP